MASAADAAPSFLYLPRLAGSPDTFTLGEEDARYVARVVRAKPGERLRASDGAGLSAELVVETVRPDVLVRVVHRHAVIEAAPRVLLVGAPEGERGDWLVEKCAELGVTRFVPVDGERAQWPEGARVERWQRLAVAALRQSCGSHLMAIASPEELRKAVTRLPAGERWVADPAGGAPPASSGRPREAICGAVGPSPGFSAQELKVLADNDFLPVALAPRRLRTETAALAMAALWATRDAVSESHA